MRTRVTVSMPRVTTCSLLLVALLLVGCEGDRQARENVGAGDSDQACERCVPTFDAVAELDFGNAPAGPESVFQEIFIARVPRTDNWLVAVGSSLLLFEGPSPGQILLPAPQFVREIGRTGPGPGEHGQLRGLHFDAADSLLIVDSSNSRIDVYAPDLHYVRSIRVPVRPYHSDLMRDGSVLVAGSIAGRAPFDRFLARIVDRDGEVTEVVPAPQLEDEVDRDAAFATLTATGVGFHMSRPFAYTVVRFNADGTPRDSITADPDWFVPADYSDPRYAMLGLEVARPSITSLMTDEAGRLWIQTTRPVTADSLPEPSAVLSGGAAAFTALARSVLDYAIEAYDIETGLRTAGQLYADPTHFMGNGFGYQYIEDPRTGTIDVRIVRFGVAPG